MKKATLITIGSFLVAFCILAIVLFLFYIGGKAQEERYERVTKENCEQYNDVPEKYSSRVPTACTGQYFSHLKQANKERVEQQMRDINAAGSQ